MLDWCSKYLYLIYIVIIFIAMIFYILNGNFIKLSIFLSLLFSFIIAIFCLVFWYFLRNLLLLLIILDTLTTILLVITVLRSLFLILLIIVTIFDLSLLTQIYLNRMKIEFFFLFSPCDFLLVMNILLIYILIPSNS